MPFGDDDCGPRTSTNIRGKPRMYSCRACDGTGIRSAPGGGAVYCTACDGTTIAKPGQGDRIRASWGPRSIR